MVRGRRMALRGLVALVACGQALCVLELCGVPLPAPAAVLAIDAAIVLAAALTAKGEEPIDLARWAGIGLATWIFWGTLYFGAARITEAPAARTFDDAVLARLPLVPAFASVYLGVHIFSMVPYCALPETRLLRRYLLGNVLLVSVAAIAWVTLPVRVDRPPIPPELSGFGTWLLHLVYRGDPTTNCFPSAHCGVAVYAAIGLRFASRRLFAWGIVTAIGVCVSTVLTKQHYVLDVLAGAVLAALTAWAMSRRT